MPLDQDTIVALGGLVVPFARNSKPREVHPQEAVAFAVLQPEQMPPAEFWQQLAPYLIPTPAPEDDLRYEHSEQLLLWVIDAEGLKILPENTPNPRAPRGCVCHTNLTGGAAAIQGGQMWLSTDQVAYVDPFSGRYGANCAPYEPLFQAFLTWLRNQGIFADVIDISGGPEGS